MPLILESLEKAVKALIGVLSRSQDVDLMGSLDSVSQNAIRSGVIQHFEFTYELCWKFMKRRLEVNLGSTVVDGVSRRELFRLSAENLLIEDVEKWMRFHDGRNRITHTYEEEVAQKVYELIPEFLGEAKNFLEILKKKND